MFALNWPSKTKTIEKIASLYFSEIKKSISLLIEIISLVYSWEISILKSQSVSCQNQSNKAKGDIAQSKRLLSVKAFPTSEYNFFENYFFQIRVIFFALDSKWNYLQTLSSVWFFIRWKELIEKCIFYSNPFHS